MLRRARVFAARYADAEYERGESQSFWNEFLDVFGIDRKRVNASFEHATERASTGKIGFIDLFWPGVLLVEQKSANKDLEKAEFQARDYLPGLSQTELPRALVMSDFKEVRIVRLDGDGPESFVFKTAELPEEIDRFGFLTQQRDIAIEREEQANADAVELMGQLYEQLVESGYEGHAASVFMVRMLFLLFGDDTGLWRAGLFQEFIAERTVGDGSDTGAQLGALFQVLDRHAEQRSKNLDHVLAQFPYVNGGLFAERIDVPSFSSGMRSALLACCAFDWAKISPAIFGSMFQTVKSRVERREAGEHYTTEENILRLIRPLFLDELYASLSACGHDERKIRKFHDSLSGLKFMDPACGCGNFVVVAYRELRALELEILRRLRNITGQVPLDIDITRTLRVSPEQFYGIELNEWPVEIAKTAFFMVDHQANKELAAEFGAAPERLPIELTADIRVGNALHLDWGDICPPSSSVTILGNPPFIGQYSKTAEQKEDTKRAWGKRYNGYLDYVTSWYAKSLDYFGEIDGRWAFVSTNSICQGEAAAPLWEPIRQAGWRCRFAHRSFEWSSEAKGKAAVHVSIVGFDRMSTKPRPKLWSYGEDSRSEAAFAEVSRINPYLYEGPDLFVRPSSDPVASALPTVRYGSKPVDDGGLVVEPKDYSEVASDPRAAKFIRKYVGAREMLHDLPRWCLWLVGASSEEIRASRVLTERVEKVRAFRAASPKKVTRESAATPAIFQEIRQPTSPYLCIPSVVGVSRAYFTAAYFEPDVITSNLAFTAPDDDGFLLGVLSSSMFIVWMRAIGGRLKSDPRFSNSFTYNSFPMPELSAARRKAIAQAGGELIAVRQQHEGRTLADLYDPLAMPSDLVAAHRKIDQAVDKAFGLRGADRENDARRSALFRNYVKRGEGDTLDLS